MWNTYAEEVAETIATGAVVLIDGHLKGRVTVENQGEKAGQLSMIAWSVSVVGTLA